MYWYTQPISIPLSDTHTHITPYRENELCTTVKSPDNNPLTNTAPPQSETTSTNNDPTPPVGGDSDFEPAPSVNNSECHELPASSVQTVLSSTPSPSGDECFGDNDELLCKAKEDELISVPRHDKDSMDNGAEVEGSTSAVNGPAKKPQQRTITSLFTAHLSRQELQTEPPDEDEIEQLNQGSQSLSTPLPMAPQLSSQDDFHLGPDPETKPERELTDVERFQKRLSKHIVPQTLKRELPNTQTTSQMGGGEEGGAKVTPLLSQDMITKLQGKPGNVILISELTTEIPICL